MSIIDFFLLPGSFFLLLIVISVSYCKTISHPLHSNAKDKTYTVPDRWLHSPTYTILAKGRVGSLEDVQSAFAASGTYINYFSDTTQQQERQEDKEQRVPKETEPITYKTIL